MDKFATDLMKAVQHADKLATSALAARLKVAQMLAEQRQEGETTAAAYKRLMALLKETVKQAGYTIQDKNLLSQIGAGLLLCLEPEAEIAQDVPSRSKKSGPVKIIKKAADCKTAAEVMTAAKQIRESAGLADGRRNNGTKQVANATRASFWDELPVAYRADPQRVLDILLRTDQKAVVDALRAKGWAVVAKGATAKAKPKAKPESALVAQVQQMMAA